MGSNLPRPKSNRGVKEGPLGRAGSWSVMPCIHSPLACASAYQEPPAIQESTFIFFFGLNRRVPTLLTGLVGHTDAPATHKEFLESSVSQTSLVSAHTTTRISHHLWRATFSERDLLRYLPPYYICTSHVRLQPRILSTAPRRCRPSSWSPKTPYREPLPLGPSWIPHS